MQARICMHLVGNVCFKKRLVGITKGIGSRMLKTAIVFFIFNEPLKKKKLGQCSFKWKNTWQRIILPIRFEAFHKINKIQNYYVSTFFCRQVDTISQLIL